jgi:3-hydroxyisobutyrate dehydrogenase
MTTVAFIGLGNMGYPMASHLLAGGVDVVGVDVSATACRNFEAAGGRVAPSIAQAVSQADVVMSMVPTGEHVRQVYTGPEGVIRHAKPGALLIDSSTIDVDTARQVIQAAADAGFSMVDAPVSGAVPAAKAATLVFMVGGTADQCKAVEPILKHMGTSVVHIGPSGSGQAMKICNNMMLGMSMVTLSETLSLAEKLGLDFQKVYDVVTKGSGNCWALQVYCPVPGPVPASPASNGYTPSFPMTLMLKDMMLSQNEANSVGAATPFAGQIARLYEQAVKGGYADKDFSYIFNIVSGRAPLSKDTAND